MNHVKIQLPAAKTERVPRPHLMARLEEVYEQPRCLALVIAPSGFGKTTLAADWAAGQPSQVAWLSLDVEDNDVMTFLDYLTAAIRSVEADIGSEAIQMIRFPRPTSHLIVLKSLLNDLAKRSQPLVVVLDDYQVISSNSVREAIIYLLERMPSALRIVLLSRSDPPFALPILRMQQRLIEIRATDLRFSSEETELFLHKSMNLPLSSEDIARLNQRIDGWPAGLQMAGLAMRGRQNDIDFIQNFSGSNHYIVDHLAGSVFERQEKHQQTFLLKTCILTQVSAALANAMLQTRPIKGYEELHGEDTAGEDCQKMLENLFRSDMFTLPLNEEHTWFQYHPLFADILRSRLHVVDHSAFKELHLQAHAWHKQNGNIQDAVNHALMAEEPLQAILLIEQHAVELLNQGNLAALDRWIGMLVEDEVRSRPWLCISQAWINIFAGRLSGLDGLLKHAEWLSNQGNMDGHQQISIQCAIIRSYLAVLIGNITAAVKWNKSAARRLEKSEDWTNSMHHWVGGAIARMQGKLDQSGNSFASAIHIGETIGNTWTMVTAATDQGLVKYVQGDLFEARQIFENALRVAHQQNAEKFVCISRLLTALANIDYDQGQMEVALSRVEEAIKGNRYWKNPNNLAYAYATCARIQLGVKDFSGASDTLQHADHEMRGLPVPGAVVALLDSVRVRLWLSSGDLLSAAGWVAKNADHLIVPGGRRKSSRIYQEDLELNQATAIRVLLAQKRLEDANRLLDQLLPAASAGGRSRAAIEFMILRSEAFEAAGQIEAAVDWLENALQLASQSDFIQIFVDEASNIQHLLDLAADSDREGSVFARRVQAVLAAPKPVLQVRSIPKQVRVQHSPVIGSLSKREKEVLNLIAAGLTNHQIGLRLVISTGTVKAHSANIYRKLAAGNRFQAVERARELNLLA